ALRPGAPVVAPREERVERFTPPSRRVVPLEERKPIREARLPRDAELVAAFYRPSGGVEEAAVVLAHVLGLEGKSRQAGERGGVDAEVVQVEPIPRRLLVGMREGSHISRAQSRRLAERKLVIETQQPRARGGLGKLVSDEVEGLQCMRTGLE